MKGLIIIGYQGIGKSSCAGPANKCVDLESGNLFIGHRRAEDWYVPYCQTAMNLANQGFTVFTSSHKCVRDLLTSMPRPENVGAVVIFCPRLSMRDVWIQRLQERYNMIGLWKDYNALASAKERYDENILELTDSPLPVYQPDRIDYDLMDYVRKIRWEWCSDDGDREDIYG